MKLLDKFKNMFTDEVEEDDDVKVEQIKKEVTHVPIETPILNKVEVEEENTFEPDISENVNKPIFFDEKDFNDLEISSREEEKKSDYIENKIETENRTYEKEIYKTHDDIEEIEKRTFKPTPIISPVYGILDKNYHKEDIISRSEPKRQEKNSEPTVDTIRNKAYGTLEDELENTLFGSNSILFKNNFKSDDNEDVEVTEVDDDILSNLTDDISKELDELLIKKEKYSDDDMKKTVKKDDNLNEEDLLGFIDSTLYKRGDEE